MTENKLSFKGNIQDANIPINTRHNNKVPPVKMKDWDKILFDINDIPCENLIHDNFNITDKANTPKDETSGLLNSLKSN